MEKNMINTPEGMEILDTSVPGIEKVLTEECLEFIYDLEKNFGHKRKELLKICLLYTSPSPRDISGSRMPSSA